MSLLDILCPVIPLAHSGARTIRFYGTEEPTDWLKKMKKPLVAAVALKPTKQFEVITANETPNMFEAYSRLAQVQEAV